MVDVPDALAGTTLGRVALRVADPDRVADFYASVVGLSSLSREASRVVLGAGDALLELHETDAPARGRDEAGLFHTAFRVPSRSALGAAVDRIEERWRLDGAADHRVSEAVYLADPEGNGVEVYCDRPAAAWPTDDAGRVRMGTDPLALDDLPRPPSREATVPSGTDVGHVHLEATSLPASRAFYVDALGLRVRQAFGSSALFLAADDYHHHVGLNTWNRRTAPARSRGLAWFELVVPTRPALDAVADRLDERDVAYARDGTSLRVSDPDGLALRLRVAGE